MFMFVVFNFLLSIFSAVGGEINYRDEQVWSQSDYYMATPPKKDTKPVIPDLQILQHLSPNSPTYQDLIGTFTAVTKTPIVEHQAAPILMRSPQVYSPLVEIISPLPQEEPVVYKDAPEEFEEASPDIGKNNALLLFDVVNEETMESTTSNPDLKRKVADLENEEITKRLKLGEEWQLHENDKGEQFFINLQTGQILRDVPSEEAGFTIAERRHFMPFGTSPIMKLAPDQKLELDSDKQKVLHQNVEKRKVAPDASAITKWNCLEEMILEKENLGKLSFLFEYSRVYLNDFYFKGLNEMIQSKVLDAGMRSLPELESRELFKDDTFAAIRSNALQYEFSSNMLDTTRVCL
jgi:hypothetical protein